MGSKLCTEPGCSKPHFARGFCRTHYTYKWRHGTLPRHIKEMPRTMTSEEAAWVAGLFEGEGWVGWNGNGKQRYPGLALNMTDRDVVERFQTLVGAGNVRIRPARGNNKELYMWSKSGHDFVADLYRQIKPWLLKRRSARFDEVLRG